MPPLRSERRADTAQKAIDAMEKTVLDAGWDGNGFFGLMTILVKKSALLSVKKGKFLLSLRDSASWLALAKMTDLLKKQWNL